MLGLLNIAQVLRTASVTLPPEFDSTPPTAEEQKHLDALEQLPALGFTTTPFLQDTSIFLERRTAERVDTIFVVDMLHARAAQWDDPEAYDDGESPLWHSEGPVAHVVQELLDRSRQRQPQAPPKGSATPPTPHQQGNTT